MIAGPNGSGKTTIAVEFIPHEDLIDEFLNADEIARGLAPVRPESMALTASKLMLQRFKTLMEEQRSFAFETTASGTNYVKHLEAAKAKGYQISLIFLWLISPEQATRRVQQRVKHGGHLVPEDVIHRRYGAGLQNLFKHYLPLADRVMILDNSSEDSPRRLIARKNLHGDLEILDLRIWKKIEESIYERRI